MISELLFLTVDFLIGRPVRDQGEIILRNKKFLQRIFEELYSDLCCRRVER